MGKQRFPREWVCYGYKNDKRPVYLVSLLDALFFYDCDWDVLVNHNIEIKWSGRRDSNSRPSGWQPDALPTELLPRASKNIRLQKMRQCFFCFSFVCCRKRMGI